MSKTKTILMLTKSYPYGTEESFIENEIKILSKNFQEIIIIACEVPHKEIRIREVPKNVRVHRILNRNKKMQMLIDILMSVRLQIKTNQYLKNEYNNRTKLGEKIFMRYFEAKAKRIFSSIIKEKILETVKDKKLVLYSYWLFTTARVGSMIMEKMKLEVVYSFTRAHRYDLYKDRNPLNYLPERELLLSSYDNIFPCSENGTIYLKEEYPEFSHKIEKSLLGTIDNGVSEPSKDGVFRIVSCSRVEPLKRVERLASSLALLDNKLSKKDSVKIEWTHIGSGSGFDKLKKQVNNTIKNITVRFTGNISNNEVLDFYKENPVDLFINVSNSEGLPVSIMEATSYSIPIIATNVGGTNEIVFNGNNGFLISSDFKDEELINYIEKMVSLKLNGEYDKFRKKTRKIWEDNFRAIENYNSLCEKILETIK